MRPSINSGKERQGMSEKDAEKPIREKFKPVLQCSCGHPVVPIKATTGAILDFTWEGTCPACGEVFRVQMRPGPAPSDERRMW